MIARKGTRLLITFEGPLLGNPALTKKIVSARRRNQHARRVRYPELLPNTCEEMVGRDSVEPGRIDGSAQRRPTVQCAGTMGLVSQPRAHPVNRPISYPRDKTFFFTTQFHLPIELVKNFMRPARQNWRNQNRDDTKRFGEGIENCDQIKLGKPTPRIAASEP